MEPKQVRLRVGGARVCLPTPRSVLLLTPRSVPLLTPRSVPLLTPRCVLLLLVPKNDAIEAGLLLQRCHVDVHFFRSER